MEAFAYTDYESFEGRNYLMSPVGYHHSKVNLFMAPLIKSLLFAQQKDGLYEVTQDAWVIPREGGFIAPDIAVFKKPVKVFNDKVIGVPVFAVEVLSPSTGRKDRTAKKAYYEKIGIGEYWIVDPLNKTIEVYKLDKNNAYRLEDIYQKFCPEDWEMLTEKEEHPQMIRLDFLGIEVDVKDLFED